jgi:parallel beta-helix repeat protein
MGRIVAFAMVKMVGHSRIAMDVERFFLEDFSLNLISNTGQKRWLQGELKLGKIISGMMIALLVLSVFPLALSIQPVKAAGGTSYLRADESVDPPSAPIWAASSSVDWWSMFRHDVVHSGSSLSTGPFTNGTLWTYATNDSVVSSPAVADGVVYVGSNDHCVYALDASTGSVIWSCITGDIVESSPAVVGGVVYVGSTDGKVYALDAATGASIWNYTTGGGVFSSPAVVGSVVYVGSADGKVHALNAATGASIWNYTVGSTVESSPAVVGGVVYVGSWGGKVYALNASTGARIWDYTTGSWVRSSPTVDPGGRVYVGSYDHKVYALNAATGASIWNYTTSNSIFSSPAVVKTTVYVGSTDGKVYALDAATGASIWNFTTGGAIYSSVAAAAVGGAVYVGSSDHNVYALNYATGALTWSYATGSNVFSSPAVADDTVYVGSYDGKVYAFGSAPALVYIRADGSVDPWFAPIANAGNAYYTLKANISGSIMVERNNIVVYGAGYALEGAGTGDGISLTGRSNVTIKSLRIRNFRSGINLTSSSGNTLIANTIKNSTYYGIYLDSSSSNSVSANTITNSTKYGIYLYPSSSSNSISANTITSSTYGGIYLDSSSSNSISANTITNNNDDGIFLVSSSSNSISGNTITNNTYGMLLYSSSGNTLIANTITNSTFSGIYLDSSSSNSISANTITNDDNGIVLYSSFSNSVSANTIANNLDGIYLDSSSSNSVSVNTITSSTYDGIYLDSSYSNSISANTITNNNDDGIELASSSSNSITTNTITNNKDDGIYLFHYSNGNCISANGITSNYYGIYVYYYSNGNSISANTIANNNYGIIVSTSSTNIIWHNNFIDNARQASVTPGYLNTWDNGYPSGGNYWSNYTGVDLYTGPNQNVARSDEIGDTPYAIDAYSVDHYPLMIPWKPTLAVENVVTWRWGGNTTITCVAAGDVDGDGASEIVTGGYYFDGVRNVALLHVWNGSTLTVERSVPWFWGGNTVVTSLAVGDVDGDGKTEIVTGGYYFDGVRNVAQLHVWNGATLAVKKVQTWYWGGNTIITCLAIADADGDGQKEIVTGGCYFDGTRTVALLHVWNGSTLAVKKVQSWAWGGDTTVNCLAVGDLYGDGQKEIVTGGYYFDGTRRVAQLHVWNGTTLAVKAVTTWCWSGSTEISSVCVGDVDGDGASEIVTGGFYFDGVRNVALLHVWNAALSVERSVRWFWGGDTKALSVAFGDVDGDGKTEIVTGGYYFDGAEKVAQLHVWDNASFDVKDVKTWYWAGNTVVNSVAIGDVDNDLLSEIVTSGTFYSGSYDNAQLMEWSVI